MKLRHLRVGGNIKQPLRHENYQWLFYVTTCLFWFVLFFSLGTRSDEIITSTFLFMKKHFRYFFLWKIYLFPYFEDVLYLPSPPSPPFWLSKRSSPIYREIGPDWVSLWQDQTFRNRARFKTIRARFNKNSSPISFGIRSETYRTRLDNGPDLLSCSIKRNQVRVNIRVRLKNIELDYPETGKHPLIMGLNKRFKTSYVTVLIRIRFE